MAKDRSVTARLPLPLVHRLEEAQFRISRATGKRVSTKQLVQEALERFLDQVEKKLQGTPPAP